MATLEVKMRLNTETESVEILINDEVLAESGQELFANWVNWYNEQHAPEVVVEEIVETPAEEVPAEGLTE